MSTVEKKERLEYRNMHSSYQITACLDKEHSESDDSFWVAFTTHCPHVSEETSPLHMNSPYTVSELFLPPETVVLWNSSAVALEINEEKRVPRFDLKVLLAVVSLLEEQLWTRKVGPCALVVALRKLIRTNRNRSLKAFQGMVEFTGLLILMDGVLLLRFLMNLLRFLSFHWDKVWHGRDGQIDIWKQVNECESQPCSDALVSLSFCFLGN